MIARNVTPHTPVTSLFADEFSQGPNYTNWRPNGSGDWLMIYTASGSGAIGTQEKTVYTSPGDLLLYEPGAMQDYRTAPKSRKRWRLLWSHFLARPTWNLWSQWPELAPGIRLIHLSAAHRIPCEEALRRMIRAVHRAGPIQTDFAFAALEEVILHGRAAQAEAGDAPADTRIARAVAHLTDHFKEPFHLPTLARQCSLSVSRFAHLFHHLVGMTPGQFLERQRLSHATHLLRLTSLTITEISGECGFENPFYFTNRFRRHHGVSPTAFRLRLHKNR